jgi:HEAT repeat protein
MTDDQRGATPDIEGAIRLLKSEDVQIRQFVAYLLGQSGDGRAIEPLIDALQDEHVGVRGAAANALGALGDQSAVPYLKPLLKHHNPQLVVWAAFALTRLGLDHFSYLEEAIQSPEVDVRRSAILAMQQLRDQRAIPSLLLLVNDQERRFDTDSTVGEAAHRALIYLG